MADASRRRGRPSRFDPDLGRLLIEQVVDRGEPLGRSAKRMGVGVRTVYDWLQRAESTPVDEVDPLLKAWALRFRDALAKKRRLGRAERFDRETRESRARWRKFRDRRAEWWRERLGDREFYRRRLEWLAARDHWVARDRLVEQLRASGWRVTTG